MGWLPFSRGALARWVTVSCAFVCLFSSACSSENPHLTPAQDEETSGLDDRAEYGRSLAQELGVLDPPRVDLVREIGPNREGAELVFGCMIEFGYNYEFEEYGDGVSIDMRGVDQDAWARDMYICSMKYPLEGKFREPWDSDRWGALYDYWTQEYMPCLADYGYEVESPPSREVFVAQGMSGSDLWMPAESVLDQVNSDVKSGRFDSFQQFDFEVCQQDLPLEYYE